MSAPRPYPIFLDTRKPKDSTMLKVLRAFDDHLPAQRSLSRTSTKFMLSLRDENFRILIALAKARDISIQELIRAVIIPEWTKAGRKNSRNLPTA